MKSSFGLVQVKLRRTRDHFQAVIHVNLDKFLESQELRQVVHKSEVIDAESRLQLRIFEQIIQNNFGDHILAHFNHDAHAFAARFVTNVGNAVDALILHEFCNLLTEFGLVDHVRNFAHDNARLTAAIDIDFGTGTHAHAAMTREVCIADARAATNHAAGRKVRTRHILQKIFARNIRIFGHRMDCICNFAQVVRSHGGCHTHGDTRGTVHQHVRESRRQDLRFFQRFVEVRTHVDGIFFKIFEHEGTHVVHLGFGVTHCSSAVAVDRTEVTLTEHQRVAQREVLRHTHQGFVHGRVAMRVVFTDHVTHDTGRLHRRLVGHHAQLVHTVHHTAVHRLKAITRIRQGTCNNHAHGIAQVAILHVLFNQGPDLRTWYQFF